MSEDKTITIKLTRDEATAIRYAITFTFWLHKMYADLKPSAVSVSQKLLDF